MKLERLALQGLPGLGSKLEVQGFGPQITLIGSSDGTLRDALVVGLRHLLTEPRDDDPDSMELDVIVQLKSGQRWQLTRRGPESTWRPWPESTASLPKPRLPPADAINTALSGMEAVLTQSPGDDLMAACAHLARIPSPLPAATELPADTELAEQIAAHARARHELHAAQSRLAEAKTRHVEKPWTLDNPDVAALAAGRARAWMSDLFRAEAQLDDARGVAQGMRASVRLAGAALGNRSLANVTISTSNVRMLETLSEAFAKAVRTRDSVQAQIDAAADAQRLGIREHNPLMDLIALSFAGVGAGLLMMVAWPVQPNLSVLAGGLLAVGLVLGWRRLLIGQFGDNNERRLREALGEADLQVERLRRRAKELATESGLDVDEPMLMNSFDLVVQRILELDRLKAAEEEARGRVDVIDVRCQHIRDQISQTLEPLGLNPNSQAGAEFEAAISRLEQRLDQWRRSTRAVEQAEARVTEARQRLARTRAALEQRHRELGLTPSDDGGRLPADFLSVPARIHLAIGLRVAWLREQENGGPALPLIFGSTLRDADDETFEAAARVLFDIARRDGRQILCLESNSREVQRWRLATGLEPPFLQAKRPTFMPGAIADPARQPSLG